jgi:pimeloyl-ACP methyl ester carboxylesterase
VRVASGRGHLQSDAAGLGVSRLATWGHSGGAQSADPAQPGTLELAHHLALVEQDSLGGGDQGWWDDNVAFLTPWGFDPASIGVPVQLWHGEADKAVPSAFGHWLAERIPGVDAHFPANDDHGSIHDGHLAEAYEWLRHQV